MYYNSTLQHIVDSSLMLFRTEEVFCHLKVPVLRTDPVLDVALRISGETEHEVPLDLQLVYGLNGLMNLGNERDVS